MSQDRRLIERAVEIQSEDALTSDAVGFMGRSLVLATLPHRRLNQTEFIRRNGRYTLTILSPSYIGLPYGSYPRLILAWITREAVRTNCRELDLGPSLRAFLGRLEITPSGGRNGPIGRFRDQCQRLFCANISCLFTGEGGWEYNALNLADNAALWWDPRVPGNACRWQPELTLGSRFFEHLTSNPVPIDLRALFALRKSPLAMDVYTWVTYRMSRLRHPLTLAWSDLECQFGSQYKHTRYFSRRFEAALRKVLVVYDHARVESHPTGLKLIPSKPHVPFLSCG